METAPPSAEEIALPSAEEIAPPPKACPECAAPCSIDAQFCSHCGFPVGALTVSRHDPVIGSVLAGAYHVLELIGVGGMGRVYRAQQRALGRTVAVKLIHPHLAAQEKSLARFLTEARATSQLNHPHTVSVIDFGKTDQGQPYMVMEFLRGRNLAQVVAFEGLLPLPRLLRIVRQILLALGEAHAHGIIHRDLKPENVIVESLRRGGDFVKVVDFGLAKLKADDQQPGVTAPGLVCGTPDYMAPEQGRGDPIDGRSDLYAVGVVLFWLLCGRLPFEATTPAQVVLMHITAPLPDPTELAPAREMPLAVLEVLYRALEKDPDARYPDAHAFVDAIDALISASDRSSWAPLLSPGTPVEVPTQSVDCLSCNGVVPWANFCLACGAALPSRSQPHSPTISAVSLPFVERGPELGWLIELLECTRVQCVSAFIMGEEGVGKTRLLEEFIALASEQGALVLTGHSSPRRVAVSGFTLLDLLDQLGQENGRSSDGSSPTSSLRALEDPKYATLAPIQRRDAYAQILLHELEQATLGGQRPLVVALDDLDRVDGLSRQVLQDVAGRLTGSRILLVGTHGPAFREDWVTAGVPAEVLALSGLPVHVTCDLLRKNLSGELPLVLDTAQLGIPPLYAVHVLAFILDGGSEPPSRLADLIDRRTTLLPSDKRAILQALAVLGEQVPEELLTNFLDEGAPSSVNSETLSNQTETLAELEAASFLRREPDGTLSLAHPILYKLVLLATPVEVRRELHRRAGILLRKRGEAIEVLAEHAMLAQDPVFGLALLEQAASRALRLGDEAGATYLLERGLNMARQEIFRGEIDDPLSAVVIFSRKLGELLKARGLLADARGVLTEALDSASHTGKDRAEILALLAEIARSAAPPPP